MLPTGSSKVPPIRWTIPALVGILMVGFFVNLFGEDPEIEIESLDGSQFDVARTESAGKAEALFALAWDDRIRAFSSSGTELLFRDELRLTDSWPNQNSISWTADGGYLLYTSSRSEADGTVLQQATAFSTADGKEVVLTATDLMRNMTMSNDNVSFVHGESMLTWWYENGDWAKMGLNNSPTSVEYSDKPLSSSERKVFAVDAGQGRAGRGLSTWSELVIYGASVNGRSRTVSYLDTLSPTSSASGFSVNPNRNRLLTTIEHTSPFSISYDEVGELAWRKNFRCASWYEVVQIDLRTGSQEQIDLPSYQWNGQQRDDWVVHRSSYDLAGNIELDLLPKGGECGSYDAIPIVSLTIDIQTGLMYRHTDGAAATEMLFDDGSSIAWTKNSFFGQHYVIRSAAGEPIWDGRDRNPVQANRLAIWSQNEATVTYRGDVVSEPIELGDTDRLRASGTRCSSAGSRFADESPVEFVDITGDGFDNALVYRSKNETNELTAIYSQLPATCDWVLIFGELSADELDQLGFGLTEFRQLGYFWCLGKDGMIYSFGPEVLIFNFSDGVVDLVDRQEAATGPTPERCRS